MPLFPNGNGRPSPIVVRLFELKHPVTFENADFFSLYERAKETLAPDLVASEEIELRPGESEHPRPQNALWKQRLWRAQGNERKVCLSKTSTAFSQDYSQMPIGIPTARNTIKELRKVSSS